MHAQAEQHILPDDTEAVDYEVAPVRPPRPFGVAKCPPSVQHITKTSSEQRCADAGDDEVLPQDRNGARQYKIRTEINPSTDGTHGGKFHDLTNHLEHINGVQ